MTNQMCGLLLSWDIFKGSVISLYSDHLVNGIIFQIIKGCKSVKYCIVNFHIDCELKLFVSERMCTV